MPVRIAVLAAAWTFLLCPGAAAQADPFALLFGDTVDAGVEDRPGEDDVRFVGVRLGDLRLKNTLTAYERAEGLCLVAADLFTLLEAPIDVTSAGAKGWFLARDRSVEIDVSGQKARLKEVHEIDLSGTVFATEDGWCMTGDAWSQILPIDVSYDPTSLLVHLQPRETLPLEARLEREALRELLVGEAGPARPDYRKVEAPYRWISWPTADLALDITSQSAGATTTKGSLELAGDLVFATARLRTTQTQDGDTGLRLSFERVFETAPHSLRPRQIRFGDVAGISQPLIARSETGRGLTITNRPAYVANVFDVTDVRGPLPDGWEAELHLEGQLLDFREGPNQQGEYLFEDVEIRPGYNRYTVKLFGPFGETLEREVKLFAGQEMHPEHEVQYEFAVLEEGTALDGFRSGTSRPSASASLQYGVSRSLTVRLDAKATALGEAAATTSLVGAHGDTQGVLRLAASSFGGPAAELGVAHLFDDRSSLDVRYAWNGGLAPLSSQDRTQPPRQSVRLDYDATAPVLRHGLPVRTRLVWQEALDGTQRLTAGVNTSSSHQGWRWGATSFYERVWGHQGGDIQALQGSFSLARTLSGLRIRAGLDYDVAPTAQVKSLDIALQRRLPRGGFGQVSIAHDMQGRRTQASASYARDLGPVSISATTGLDDRGAWSAGIRLATSLFHDRHKGRYAAALPGLTRTGAIRANVFDDIDEDGVLSSVDRAIQGASFIVDQSIRKEESGADGGVTLGGVEPYRSINMELSLGSLDDPFLQPIEPGHAVTVRPGQVIDLNVPLSLSGEVDGTVVLTKAENDVPVAGVLIQAVDSAGRVVGEALSEYDGYFYLDGLPMGDLVLRVAPEALDSINGTSETIELSLTRGGPSAFGVALSLTQLS
ncbi:MAG: hypothetical protein AAFX86_14785 [Pseudomonadota bacterium]